MSLDANFDGAAKAWSDVTGNPGIYHAIADGRTISLEVTIERGVESIDDNGLMGRRDVAVILRADVRRPVLGDTIQVDGKSWVIRGFDSSDAHAHVLFVVDEGIV